MYWKSQLRDYREEIWSLAVEEMHLLQTSQYQQQRKTLTKSQWQNNDEKQKGCMNMYKMSCMAIINSKGEFHFLLGSS